MYDPNRRYMQREDISYEGITFNLSTTSIDTITWHKAYARGYREGNFPVPALITEVFLLPQHVSIYVDVHPEYADYLYFFKGEENASRTYRWE